VPVEDEDPIRELHHTIDQALRVGVGAAVVAAEAAARKREEQERQAERDARRNERETRTAQAEQITRRQAPIADPERAEQRIDVEPVSLMDNRREADKTGVVIKSAEDGPSRSAADPAPVHHDSGIPAVRGLTTEQVQAHALGHLNPGPEPGIERG
jgi:hypothetical protein